ncbi:hypothetical protein ACQKOF_21645 [Lysinibacillus sp. NPDC093190]|uniref:hypothetical protein n=1 Tax=Lysinibacillus sp. NPDC093190 TaxID=3390575 RepID=UPI003CFFC058
MMYPEMVMEMDKFSCYEHCVIPRSFFSSIRLTGVAIETVVTIGSARVFSGALEWILWKSQPTKVWGIATVIAIH